MSNSSFTNGLEADVFKAGSPSLSDDTHWRSSSSQPHQSRSTQDPRGFSSSFLEGHFTRLSTPPSANASVDLRHLTSGSNSGVSTSLNNKPPLNRSLESKGIRVTDSPLSTRLNSISDYSKGPTSSWADARGTGGICRSSREGSVGQRDRLSRRTTESDHSARADSLHRREGSIDRRSNSCCRAVGSECRDMRCDYAESQHTHYGSMGHVHTDGGGVSNCCDCGKHVGGTPVLQQRHSYHEGYLGRQHNTHHLYNNATPASPHPCRYDHHQSCSCSTPPSKSGGNLKDHRNCSSFSSTLPPSSCQCLGCGEQRRRYSSSKQISSGSPSRYGTKSQTVCDSPRSSWTRGDPDGRRCDGQDSSRDCLTTDNLQRRCQYCGHRPRTVDEHEDDLEGNVLAITDYIPLWSCHSNVVDQQRMQSLQQANESLELQVSVLTEQVEAQGEKIAELEQELQAKNKIIQETQDKLQKEVLAVTALETQRLQLLSELSAVQLQHATSQRSARTPHQIQMSPLLAGCLTSPSPSTVSALSVINAPQSTGAERLPPPKTPPPSYNRQVIEQQGGPAIPRSSSLSQSVTWRRQQSPAAGGPPSSSGKMLLHNSNTLPLYSTASFARLAGGGSSYTLTAGDGASSLSSSYYSPPPPLSAPLKGQGKRSSSAPNLAETERQDGAFNSPSLDTNRSRHSDDHPQQGYGGPDDPQLRSSSPGSSGARAANIKTLSSGNLHNIHSIQQYRESSQPSPTTVTTSPISSHKPTTIKKIFTRLRRSSSGQMRNNSNAAQQQQERQQEFKRGGVRATATARLGWSPQQHLTTVWQEPAAPFLTWSTSDCESWLEHLGLHQYSTALRCWHSQGNHISRASLTNIEKHIGVRHPLHRKKLQLAIATRMGVESCLASNSPGNHIEGASSSAVWVSQWLDDVGLPQYKDTFHEARVDPRVLNVLTWDDLAFLKVTSLLHAVSIKRGIQVLRENNFDSSALIRRSGSCDNNTADNNNTGTNGNISSHPDLEAVSLWTNHRVMEWLRTADLSEYAPNLRGSGVHGALMVYEVRFNAEVLAALLSIPSNKTLLRRHLNTHFKDLVGRDVILEKRQTEVTPGYSPLTTATKIKPTKRSQFSLKRRSSSKGRSSSNSNTLEFDDLVCPLEERPPRAAVQQALESSPETRLC